LIFIAGLCNFDTRSPVFILMNYYDILGVAFDADAGSIKRAFRCKAKRLHPDINRASRANRDFQRVNEAYQVLGNAEKRRNYDLRLARGLHGRRVYYRPGATGKAYPRASHYTYAYKGPVKKHTPSRFEKAFDHFLFLFMLLAGLGALFIGFYRAVGEPVDGVDPYLAIFFGVVFTGLFLYGWDQKHRLES